MYRETRSEFMRTLISVVARHFGAPLPDVLEQLKLYRVPIVGEGPDSTVTAEALSTWSVH